MKNQVLFITCFMLLSSCSSSLGEFELVDWVDRAEEACECKNFTDDDCLYHSLEVVVKEGKIEYCVPYWHGTTEYLEQMKTDEWEVGPCARTFKCFAEHLKGKRVKEKSGRYEVASIMIRPKK